MMNIATRSSRRKTRAQSALDTMSPCSCWPRRNDGWPAPSVSPTATFLSSLVIVLREGLEAILVLAAMAAFLIRTGRRDSLPWLHGGWVAALLLGGITWIVSQQAHRHHRRAA
jgi:hypothetical protein